MRYMEQSENLDFEAIPRKNIFSPWLDDIKVCKNVKLCDSHFKLYLLNIAAELNYGQYIRFKNS